MQAPTIYRLFGDTDGLLDDCDPGLAEAALEGLLAQILTDAPVADRTGHLATVVAFRAVAPELDQLTAPERRLLAEWLDRVVDGQP